MQENTIYKFFPGIGFQNLNTNKLNGNFSLLAVDTIAFSFNFPSQGVSLLKFVPCNIKLLRCVAGSPSRCTLSAELECCEEGGLPNTLAIGEDNSISLVNEFYKNSAALDGAVIQAGSWIKCTISSVVATDYAEIVLVVSKI